MIGDRLWREGEDRSVRVKVHPDSVSLLDKPQALDVHPNNAFD